MSWRNRLAERRDISKREGGLTDKTDERAFVSFVSDPPGHSENIAGASLVAPAAAPAVRVDIRPVLLELADQLGIDSAHVQRIPHADLLLWVGIPGDVLRVCLLALHDTATRHGWHSSHDWRTVNIGHAFSALRRCDVDRQGQECAVKSDDATKADSSLHEKVTNFLLNMGQVTRQSLANEELTAFQRQRLEVLLEGVEANVAAIQNGHWNRLKSETFGIAFEAGVLTNDEDMRGAFESVLPSHAQIVTAALTDPLSVCGSDGGKLLETFVTDWSKSQQDAFTAIIRRGYFEGQTNARMSQAIRGTMSANSSDELVQINKRQADAMVSTAVQHAAQQARAETWKANADLSTDYEWISTLDARTCPVCRSLDRQVFGMGKGPQPPAHPQCRCTTILSIPENAWLRKGAQRASVNGPVPMELNYYQWLKQQPAEFQDEVIGPVRGKLFRDSGLSPERFAALQLDRNFQPLTLEEMRALEPAAFLKAGI